MLVKQQRASLVTGYWGQEDGQAFVVSQVSKPWRPGAPGEMGEEVLHNYLETKAVTIAL